MNDDKQITHLNGLVKTCLAPSGTHGVGVFALRDIAKGQKLGADIYPQRFQFSWSSANKLFPEVKKILVERNPRMVNNKPFIYPDYHIQAFMNHADDPNYDNRTDTLLRDVKAGEEIFEDYRNIEGWETAFPWVKKD